MELLGDDITTLKMKYNNYRSNSMNENTYYNPSLILEHLRFNLKNSKEQIIYNILYSSNKLDLVYDMIEKLPTSSIAEVIGDLLQVQGITCDLANFLKGALNFEIPMKIDLYKLMLYTGYLSCKPLTDKNYISLESPNENSKNTIQNNIMPKLHKKAIYQLEFNLFLNAYNKLIYMEFLDFFNNFTKDMKTIFCRKIEQIIRYKDTVRAMIINYLNNITTKIRNSSIKIIRDNQPVSKTNLNRPDIVLIINNKYAVIVELKYNKDDSVNHTKEEALAQIYDDKYYEVAQIDPFYPSNTYCLGVVFRGLDLEEIIGVRVNDRNSPIVNKKYKLKY